MSTGNCGKIYSWPIAVKILDEANPSKLCGECVKLQIEESGCAVTFRWTPPQGATVDQKFQY
jgi:hypothetical protein